ncbi:hypothetical protein BABINDRAFT_10126 [Babjeviella inositovora NRRL Y-12698]|uniref:Uncharacterized protein n=1 Tax=Babjeviella inositovora NRRL Y-12698 TaxID=984486 RepID=A0A1E3QIM1_9ASCO|nr:uncharacterized protein BABINDRAFT_10126 [Babjeviella inositovora NRRL Y-12698]ODQ77490.1 hypothetical protein BABINDRAFT_10126 [Babjeviella inositovora NRRL Y-12698]
MNARAAPPIWDTLPLEIAEIIFSHLPIPLVGVLRKSENPTLASVARKCYYSNLELIICNSPDESNVPRMDSSAVCMKSSEFEELANSETFDQLRIKKLSISVREDVNDSKFFHKEAFAKASSIVTDFMLEFIMDNGEVFNWASLPSSPLVWKYIREISVQSALIDPKVPPLPPNLRKLELIRKQSSWRNDDDPLTHSQPICFPPNLEEFVFHYPWGPMSVYANLPLTLRRLALLKVLNFSVEGFNELKLPNLKYLRLENIPELMEIDELLRFPSLLENLDLWWLDPYYQQYDLWELDFESFIQRKLPLKLQRLSITWCPLKTFRVGTFSNCFREMVLDHTELPSSEVRMLKFPPSLASLLIMSSRLTSLDFVKSLPESLAILNLRGNSLGCLNERDEGKRTARWSRIKFPKRLRSLNLRWNRSLFTIYPPKNFVFPPSLKDLNLESTELASVKELNIPQTLIDLDFNHLGSVEGLKNLPLLQILNLGSNKLSSVEELDIPPTLIDLDLGHNKLQRFSKTLPDGIQSVNLEHNQLRELVNFHLPVNCTKLGLSSNPLQKIQITNADNPDLKIRDFSWKSIAITALRDIYPLPQSLTRFEITGSDVCSFSEIQFPVGLKHIEATNNKINSLENVEFPPHLEVLHLRGNQISSLANVYFPDSLLRLSLDDNKITLLKSVEFPPRLEELVLLKNQISSMANVYFPDSLRRLELDHNRLASINAIQLPLMLLCLRLCNNRLSEQAMQHLDFPACLDDLHVHGNVFENFDGWKEGVRLAYPRMQIDVQMLLCK